MCAIIITITSYYQHIGCYYYFYRLLLIKWLLSLGKYIYMLSKLNKANRRWITITTFECWTKMLQTIEMCPFGHTHTCYFFSIRFLIHAKPWQFFFTSLVQQYASLSSKLKTILYWFDRFICILYVCVQSNPSQSERFPATLKFHRTERDLLQENSF